jgi:hypothetical protein
LRVLRPPGFNALLGSALAGLPPALERLFIASTRMSAQGIVAGHSNTGHGTRAHPTLSRAAARPRSQPATANASGGLPEAILALLEADYLSDVADAGLRALAT